MVRQRRSIQLIQNTDGSPAFVVIPFEEYLDMYVVDQRIPRKVIDLVLRERLSPAAAWRRHLGLTQAEMAERMGISQPAYAQQEATGNPRQATRERIAHALGITTELLDLPGLNA